MIKYFTRPILKKSIAVLIQNNQVQSIYKTDFNKPDGSYDDLIWNKGNHTISELRKHLKELKKDFPVEYDELPKIYIKKMVREYL